MGPRQEGLEEGAGGGRPGHSAGTIGCSVRNLGLSVVHFLVRRRLRGRDRLPHRPPASPFPRLSPKPSALTASERRPPGASPASWRGLSEWACAGAWRGGRTQAVPRAFLRFMREEFSPW